MSFTRIIPKMHTLSPKCIISIVFDEKYPLIAYIILDLELKNSLIAYIILELKFQISPDYIYYPRFEESTKYIQTAAPRIGAEKVLL